VLPAGFTHSLNTWNVIRPIISAVVAVLAEDPVHYLETMTKFEAAAPHLRLPLKFAQ
jgi:hypothetical protein